MRFTKSLCNPFVLVLWILILAHSAGAQLRYFEGYVEANSTLPAPITHLFKSELGEPVEIALIDSHNELLARPLERVIVVGRLSRLRILDGLPVIDVEGVLPADWAFSSGKDSVGLPGNWRGAGSGLHSSVVIPPLPEEGFLITFPPGTHAWTGAIDSDWHNPGNWHSNEVPGPFAQVRIQNGTVDVGSSGVEVFSLLMLGGTLTGTGDLSVTNNFSWVGGTLSGSGTVRIPLATLMSISGSAPKVLDGKILENEGFMTWSEGDISGDGIIRNKYVFEAASDGTMSVEFDNLSSGFLVLSWVIGTGTVNMNGPVRNAGDVYVEFSTLSLNHSFTQTGGKFVLANAQVTGSSPLSLKGGILSGYGTIAQNVINSAGTVSPGLSPGLLVFEGDYQQGDKGALLIEIGGTNPGVDSDKLEVLGSMQLDGELLLARINNFQGNLGDSLPVVSYGSLTGVFNEVTGVTASLAGNRFSIDYDPTELVLSVGATPPGTNLPNFVAEVEASGLGTFSVTDSQPDVPVGAKEINNLPDDTVIQEASSTQDDPGEMHLFSYSHHPGTGAEAKTVARGKLRALVRLNDLDNPLSVVNVPVPVLLPMLGSMEFDCREDSDSYISLDLRITCNGRSQIGALRIDWPEFTVTKTGSLSQLTLEDDLSSLDAHGLPFRKLINDVVPTFVPFFIPVNTDVPIEVEYTLTTVAVTDGGCSTAQSSLQLGFRKWIPVFGDLPENLLVDSPALWIEDNKWGLSLDIERKGGMLVLTWPVRSSSGLVVESPAEFGPGGILTWEPIAVEPVVLGDRYMIILPSRIPTQIYRISEK